MIVSPKFRGFICTTAHPEGCTRNVLEQINYVKSQQPIEGPKNVLVIGASTGYGLASRIASAFGFKASTIGVMFEKPASGSRTASAGWYNTAAFESEAKKAGLYAKSINGDAFSKEIKEAAVEMIKKDLGKIDLVVYSLASPRRTDPETGETYNSVIKPVSNPFTDKNVDFHSQAVSEVTIETASEEEIRQTVKVMGGEDWELWIKTLLDENLLSEGAVTLAYSYLGPEITHPIYKFGTIGKAKNHLDSTSSALNSMLEGIGGRAFISVNKAVVTQSSSAIPIVPLYISILFKVMKEKGIHEGCIEQMYRMFKEKLYTKTIETDEDGRLRLDDLEMRKDVQDEVLKFWNFTNSENITENSDINGFRTDFFKLFGFCFEDVDYDKDVDIQVKIPSLNEE